MQRLLAHKTPTRACYEITYTTTQVEFFFAAKAGNFILAITAMAGPLSLAHHDPSCSQAEGPRHRARPSVGEFPIFCILRIVVIILCTCQLRFNWPPSRAVAGVFGTGERLMRQIRSGCCQGVRTWIGGDPLKCVGFGSRLRSSA